MLTVERRLIVRGVALAPVLAGAFLLREKAAEAAQLLPNTIGAFNSEFAQTAHDLNLMEGRLTDSWTDETGESFAVYETHVLKRDLVGNIRPSPVLAGTHNEGWGNYIADPDQSGVTVPPEAEELEGEIYLPEEVSNYLWTTLPKIDPGLVLGFADYEAYQVWRFNSFAIQKWAESGLIERILIGEAYLNYGAVPKEACLPEMVWDDVLPRLPPKPTVHCANPPTLDQINQVMSLVETIAVRHNIDPRKFKDVCFKESGFNPFARNNRSGACGLFQFLSGTWNEVCRYIEFNYGIKGLEVWDPYDNAYAAAMLQKRDGWKPWVTA